MQNEKCSHCFSCRYSFSERFFHMFSYFACIYFDGFSVHQSKKVTIKDPMNAYFHLHSWMLFSTTALTALDFLMSKTSEEKVQRVDDNYLSAARQLYSVCLETAVYYLAHELSIDEVDSNQSITSTGRTQIDPT